MPRILIPGGLRVYFYSADLIEPIHVHVEFQGQICKIWVGGSWKVADPGKFKPHQLLKIQRLLMQHERLIKEI